MAAGFGSALPARRVLSATAFSLFGLLVWALHLAVSYGAHHVVCQVGSDGSPAVMIVAAATVIAVAVLTIAALKPEWLASVLRAPGRTDPLRPFLDSIMRWLVVLSLAGIVWSGAALGFIDACGP
jgi:hypothetical protein